MRFLHVIAALALSASSAMAQMQCDRDLLLDMATEVIDSRADLPGLSGRSTGGDAAYLLLRYGGMNAQDLTKALAAGRPYSHTEELFLAQRITQLGPEGTKMWGADPRDVLISAFWPVQRAILLLDDGDTYFDLVRQIEADPARAEKFKSTWFYGANLHALLTDQPVEVLQDTARRAEGDGHLVVAASLYALMPEGAYEAFWDRARTSGFEPLRLAGPLMMNSNGSAALVRDIAMSDPDNPAGLDQRLQRQRFFVTMKAGLAEAGTQILGISLNQSGRETEMAYVSESFLTAIENGDISPEQRPEEAWVFILSAMKEALGADPAENILRAFDQRADHRHYAGRALQVLEMATAAEAAGPWLREEVADPPGKPASLGQGFDWPRAVSVWSMVRTGGQFPDEPLTDDDFALALEGHVQRGEINAALDLAERSGGLETRLDLTRDVMLRQNRLCDQHGIIPGQSILLSGQLLYDFQ
ncbi:hypothetical protein [Roseovarius sp.]|uniref:hypothetical protein n=1 Tax=Roseovarius sp. TaxID=1486281 RepID=UPI003D099886